MDEGRAVRKQPEGEGRRTRSKGLQGTRGRRQNRRMRDEKLASLKEEGRQGTIEEEVRIWTDKMESGGKEDRIRRDWI